MEVPRSCSGLLLLLLLLFFCFLWSDVAVVDASHVEYRGLRSLDPPSVLEKHRTGYHFQPRKNWMNDPNGPMYYKGYYHLFYQYNPTAAVWGNITWAHSVSRDLINWIHLPIAIFPSAHFDIKGCWSGSATILPDGRPVILYTGQVDDEKHQVQNIAYPADLSDPLLVEWTKPPYNPIMPPTPPINALFFRDPTTAWLGPDGLWRVALGATPQREGRGIAFLYRSRDFINWVKAEHPLHSSEGTGMWECPDFYPVSAGGGREGVDLNAGYGPGHKYVLKVSLDDKKYEYYTIGTYDLTTDRYTPDPHMNDNYTGLRYDYGNFYASKTFYDPAKARRILWGWANESDSNITDIRKGWAGIQAIPRKIWLDEAGRQLVQWPVEELEQLRGEAVRVAGVELRRGGSLYCINDFRASEADVEVTFVVKNLEKAEPFDPRWIVDPEKLCRAKPASAGGGVGPFGLLVLATADRTEQTAVYFRVFKAGSNYMVLSCHDPSRSTSMSKVYKPSFGGFVDVDITKDNKITLRTLIDNSVVESFAAGGRTCITSRVYPMIAQGRSSNLFAFNNGGSDVEIEELTAWHMNRPYINY